MSSQLQILKRRGTNSFDMGYFIPPTPDNLLTFPFAVLVKLCVFLNVAGDPT